MNEMNKLTCKINWSETRFNEISTQIHQFLSQAGYTSGNVTFVPCSGLSGVNLTTRSANRDLSSWYSGPSLLECIGTLMTCLILSIEFIEPPSRSLDLPLRLSISDVSRGSKANVFHVTGRLESGVLQVGDEVISEPGGHRGNIRCKSATLLLLT
jgi:elongation factor 1 alpha-like protein